MTQIELQILTTDDKVANLCRRYWEIDDENNFIYTVSLLAVEFNIPSQNVSKLVKQNCKAFCAEDSCPRCGIPQAYTSRSDYQQRLRYNNKPSLCSNCVRKENEIKKAEQLAELERQRRFIREQFALKPYDLLNLQNLTFDDAVYLLSFIRTLASEDFTCYGPLNSSTNPLSPREPYSIEIVRQLFSHNLVAIHPETPPGVFIFENNELARMFLDKVLWTLSVGSDVEDTHFIIAQLERTFRQKNWSESWHHEYLALWKKVSLNECLEYLELVLNEHKLPFSPGEKTISVLTNLLEEYSASQIYSIIWTAGKDAAAFYLRERVAKQHAANTVIGRMQRHADRARAEGWQIKPFRRDWRCPQSVVSQILFDTALQIGEQGFNEFPHLFDE